MLKKSTFAARIFTPRIFCGAFCASLLVAMLISLLAFSLVSLLVSLPSSVWAEETLVQAEETPSSQVTGAVAVTKATISTATTTATATTTTAKPTLERMLYNHPGLLDDLAVGLWSWPVPVDFNQDGKIDIIVNSECTPKNGTFRFLNTGKGGVGTPQFSAEPQANAAMPIFQPGKKISQGQINVQASFVNGQVRVLRPGFEYPDYANTGLQKPQKLPLPENIHPNPVRGNMWKYVDFDGDGDLDVVVGIDDWTPYGWANAWNKNGTWVNAPSLGRLYVIKNEGSNEEPKYAAPYILRDAVGRELNTYGWPCPNFVDFDGDGDLDLLCGEFIESFTYFENIGSATEPQYASGTRVKLEDGSNARDVLCLVTPVCFDWNGDGKVDILCGNEDGRVCYYENTGTFSHDVVRLCGEGGQTDEIAVKAPVFKAPLYFQQEAHELKSGSLITPCCVDFDSDGDLDIVAGNSAGNVVFFENLSGPGVERPKWNRPQYLKADGRTIRIIAMPNGSIQGPIEVKFGYTTLTVADWDGDGLLDLMVNSIWGKVGWYRNIGTKTVPKFTAFQSVEVEWDGPAPELAWGWMKPEGKKLLTQWRTTPVMYDWNQDGLMDLCMLDTEGYFAFFERYRDVDGTLRLKAPQRIFLDQDGKPLRMNAEKEGGSGRRKLCFLDWNHDGLMDIAANSVNVDVYLQHRRPDGTVYFQNTGPICDLRLAGHSTSPSPTDFNADGIADIVVGAEDGNLYYMRNPIGNTNETNGSSDSNTNHFNDTNESK